MSVTLPVDSVSDTAFVTAYCRALESERADAQFQDPYARTLAGQRGEQILHSWPGAEATAASCTVRTCLMDDLLLASIATGDIHVVVNLGAGLDTRPYRLPLPAALRWIEVDHASVLDYKTSVLNGCPTVCPLARVPLDLTDVFARRELFEELAEPGRTILVMSEGILVYMTPENVASLAYDLCGWAACRFWLTDLVSPAALRMMRKALANSPGRRDVTMHFAPEDVEQFFRGHGWETARFLSCWNEGRRLERRFLPPELDSGQLSPAHQAILEKLFGVVKLVRMENDSVLETEGVKS